MKYLFITLLVTTTFLVEAQQGEKKTRSIEVRGSSEIEITPDEIFIRITLKEYKDGNKKIDLNQLESQLVKAVEDLGISENNLTIENIYGYNWNWKKRKAEDFLGSKSFVLEVNDLKKMNDLVDMLDPEGLNNMNVLSYSHSDIEGYRKKVKIEAMKAAKEKATYLLESVGSQLGELIEVQEIDYSYQSPMMRSNVAFEIAEASSYQSNVDFKKIKIRAEIRVVYGLF